MKRRSYTQLPTSFGTRLRRRRRRGTTRFGPAWLAGKAWNEYEVTHEEFVDAGDRVVVTLHLRARGRGSGVEIDARFFDVYTIRDGEIVRMDEFTERSAALEAAGLRE